MTEAERKAKERELKELELAELEAQEAAEEEDFAVAAAPKSTEVNIGGNPLNLLDVGGSPARKLLAQGIDKFFGTTLDKGQKGYQDIGQYQGTGAMMQQLGVPEGQTLDEAIDEMALPIPGLNTALKTVTPNVSTRDVMGFVGDIATDPLTYAGLPTKLVSGAGGMVEKLGKKIYKLPFKKIDAVLKESGSKPISDILWKYRLTGNAEKLRDGLKDVLSQDLWPKINDIYKSMQTNGFSLDPQQVATDLEKVLSTKYGDIFGSGKDLESFKSFLQDEAQLQTGKKMDTYKALESKKRTAENVGYKTYNKEGAQTSFTKDVEDDITSYFKEQLEKGAEAAGAGQGKQLADLNREYGTILNANPSLSKEIVKEAGTPILSNMDVGYLASPYTQYILAGKEIAEAARTKSALTKAGLGLSDMGKAAQGANLLQSTIPYGILRGTNEDPNAQAEDFKRRLQLILGE